MSNKLFDKSFLGLKMVALASLMLLPASCENEELSCTEIEAQLDQAFSDLTVAVFSADCSKIAPLFNKSIKLVKQGKNCEYVQNLIADEGHASVEEFVEYLESERDRIVDVLNC
jgi:hypothetical protein